VPDALLDRPGADLSAEPPVIISGFGDEDTGGGLWLYHRGNLECLDRLSSTGLWVGRNRLLRLLRATAPDCPAELLSYDSKGIDRYYRLDEIVDPHDIICHEGTFIIASTLSNTIFWVSPSGQYLRRWKAPGDGDAWHLNSLLLLNGELYCTAFGCYQHHRQWCEHTGPPAGLIWSLDRAAPVLGGLNHPHHPRFFDGAWAVCNSLTDEILQVKPSGESLRRVKLNGYTRGFALTERFLYVGESANRKAPQERRSASMAILTRSGWQLVERVALPCREIYDIQVIDQPALVEGIRRGFRTNATRVAEQDQHALFRQAGVEPELLWAVSEPLPPAACRVHLEACLPREMRAGSTEFLECSYESHGGAVLTSAPPYPVHIASNWRDPLTGQRIAGVEGLRTPLPHPLPPGQRHTGRVEIAAPPTPGEYLLHLTFVQEGVAWFDDLDPSNACKALVRVLPPSTERQE